MNINQFERLIRHMYCVGIGTWEHLAHCPAIPEIVEEQLQQNVAKDSGRPIPTRIKRYMPVLVWGEAGIGKSETVRRVAADLGIGFRDLRLGQLEVGDLIGMPRKEEVYPCIYDWENPRSSRSLRSKRYSRAQLLRHIEMSHPGKIVRTSMGEPDVLGTLNAALRAVGEGTQYWGLRDFRTVYAIPDWFPEPGTHGILFLDELNRSPDDVRQAIFQLILDREMHGHILPEGWIIVSANNPSDESSDTSYTVNPLEDKAFLDRFLHVALVPTPEEWLEYARGPGKVDLSIISVIASDPGLLGLRSVKIPNIEPTPRSWTVLSRIMPGLDPDLGHFVALGMLGPTAAVAWERLRYSREKPVTAEEILSDYASARVRLQAFRNHRNEEGNLDPRQDMIRLTFESLHSTLQNPEGGVLPMNQIQNLTAFIRDGLTDVADGGLGIADITSNYMQYWASSSFMGFIPVLQHPDILNHLILKLEQSGEHDLVNRLRSKGRRRGRRSPGTPPEPSNFGFFRMPQAPLYDGPVQPWFMRERPLV